MRIQHVRTPAVALCLALALVLAGGASAWVEREAKGIMRVDLNRMSDYFGRYDVDGNTVLSYAEIQAFVYEGAQLPVYPNSEYKGYPGGWAMSQKGSGHNQWAWGFNNPGNPSFGITKDGLKDLLYHFRTYDQNHNDGLCAQEAWIAVNKLGVEVKNETGNKPYAPDWAGHKGAGPGQGGSYPAGIDHYKHANPSYWDHLFSDPKAGLTRKDLNGLIADFYTADLDHDYQLNPQELQRYLHPTDPEPPAFRFQLIIGRKDLFQIIKDYPGIDGDKNGTLSYPELLSYFHKIPNPNRWGPWSPPWAVDPSFGLARTDCSEMARHHREYRRADLNEDKYLSEWEFWGYVHRRYNEVRGWDYPGQSVHWGERAPWDHPASKGPKLRLAENDIRRLYREWDAHDKNHDGFMQLGELHEALKVFATTYSTHADLVGKHPSVPPPGGVHYPY